MGNVYREINRHEKEQIQTDITITNGMSKASHGIMSEIHRAVDESRPTRRRYGGRGHPHITTNCRPGPNHRFRGHDDVVAGDASKVSLPSRRVVL